MEERRVMPPVKIKHARIFAKNFSGKERKNGNKRVNAEGVRTFCVNLEHDMALRMIDENWNVKSQPPYHDGDEESYYLPVEVRFGEYRPATVYVKASDDKKRVQERFVKHLDSIDFYDTDLTINPRVWIDDEGVRHIKAFCKRLTVVIDDDDFEDYFEYCDDCEDPEEEMPFR